MEEHEHANLIRIGKASQIIGVSLLPEAPQKPTTAVSSPQPQLAPAPVVDNKTERSPAIYGSLQPWQSAIFMNGLEAMREELSSKIMIARPHMSVPQWFSRKFEDDAIQAGFGDPLVVQQNPTGRDQTGVMVAVPDINAPSPSAIKMQAIIRELGRPICASARA
jgi:hypothetical protein